MVAVLLLLAPGASFAAQTTFYVDNASASCSDTGPGTEAQPYCSISAAAAAHKGAGITIYVKPGVYREMVTIPASGIASAPYEFKAGGGPVILDGADDFSTLSQWTQYSGFVYLATSVTWAPSQVFLNGARLTPSTAAPSALPLNSFTYVSGSGLYVNAGGGNPGTRELLVGRRASAFYASDHSYVTIDGFTVIRADDRGIRLGNSSNFCKISNNTVSFSSKYGIYVSGCSSVLVEKNKSFDNSDHGIMLTEGLNGASTNCTIQDNESFRNADLSVRKAVGILIYASTGNLIQRNLLHDNQDSGVQIERGADNNISIQNRSWHNGDHGFDQLYCANVSHIGDIAYKNFMDGFSIEGTAPFGSVYNCIAIDNGLTTNEFDLWVNSASSTGFRSDYNIFWNSTNRQPIKYINTQYATIADYSAVSGQDTHSIQADPMFLNPEGGEFHLQPGSPAIDAADSGVPNWPATDAEGFQRQDDPQTPNTGAGPVPYADRGALEFRPDIPPVAALIVTPSSGIAPLAVTADASGSTDADGTIVSYRFDFGDQTVVGPQPQPTATHTYVVAGNWTATVTVTDDFGIFGTASAAVSAVSPPVVIAPATVTVTENTPLTLNVTAYDPDGDAITSLTASGLPAGATFSAGPGNTTGTLSWTPTFAQEGSYTVTFTASNTLSGSASTAITVASSNQPPTVSLIVTPSTGNEPLTVTVDAAGSNDPDGSIVSYRFDFGDGTTPVSQTSPAASHTYAAGDWTVTAAATDNNGGTGSRSVPVIVAAVPPQPNLVTNPSFEANDLIHWNAFASCTIGRAAGGFDGAYSLEVTSTGTNTASFGLNDSPDWVGPTTGAGVTYRYTAWVRSASSAGTARIQVKEYGRNGLLLGSALSTGVRLSPAWQQITVDYTTAAFNTTLDFQVKDSPLVAGEVFRIDNVSIRNLISPSPGEDRAPAVTAPASAGVNAGLKTTLTVTATDADGDPIASLTASGLPAGATFKANPGNTTGTFTWMPTHAQAGNYVGTYTVTFTARNALSGSASTVIAVAGDQFYPNPLRSEGLLSFATARPGRLRVDIYDVSGRRVRELVNETYQGAGLHQLILDGLDREGRKLATGIYFYRIDTLEGVRTGRFAVLR